MPTMKDASRTILSAGEDDATTAFLFVSRRDPSIYAVSHDPQGTNLPSDGVEITWQCKGKFALGVREAMPVHIAPEPVLRGMETQGYFIWREGSNPRGTSQ
jgi:hypothetical protein